MFVIHKYTLEITDKQEVNIHEAFKILHIGGENGNLCLWALVDSVTVMKSITFRIFSTDQPLEEVDLKGLSYIGTAVMPPFVWHVFRIPENF